MSDEGRTHFYGDGCIPAHVEVSGEQAMADHHVTYPDAPSCHRRHICPDTDQRVAEAAREYMESVDGSGAWRKLRRAIEAQGDG